MNDLRHHRLALPLAAAAGILLGTCVFLAAKITNPRPIDWLDVKYWDLLGARAPAFELETLDGARVSDRVMGDKGYLMIFGESGCAACDVVYPGLKEVDAGFPALMISTGRRAELAAKVAAYGFRFPVAFDSMATMAKSLDLRAYPSAVFVDAEGNIAKAASGISNTVAILRLARLAIDGSE